MKMDPDKLKKTLQSITEAAQKFQEIAASDPYMLIESAIAYDLEEVDDTLWELVDLTEE